MIQNVETIGLRVESISPAPYMGAVNVNTNVQITFNADLNTKTIIGNFSIVSDKSYAYQGPESLADAKLFPQVKGSVSYKDRKVIFTPEQPLDKNTRYIVYVRAEGIRDILGRGMMNAYVAAFYTETEASAPKCQFTAPAFGVVTDRIPEFQWIDQHSLAYIFQISATPTFEILLNDTLIKNDTTPYAKTILQPEIDLLDGLYYARVKSINGAWGDSVQFFIKAVPNVTVAPGDIPEGVLLGNLSDEPGELAILDVFPKENDIQVDVQINIFYIKVLGKIEPGDIDFNNSFFVGELADEDDEGSITPHGNVSGEWDVVYDQLRNETYIIFTPNELTT